MSLNSKISYLKEKIEWLEQLNCSNIKNLEIDISILKFCLNSFDNKDINLDHFHCSDMFDEYIIEGQLNGDILHFFKSYKEWLKIKRKEKIKNILKE